MELFTEDLALRTVTEEDVREVARMWDYDRELSLDEARGHIARMEENHRKNRPGRIYHLCLAVTERAGGKIIGWCGLDGTSGDKLHIFYSLHPDFRGRGYATQAARAVLDYAFRTVGVPFVNGGCAPENRASYRVMEKTGMKPDGFAEDGGPQFYMDRCGYFGG